MVFLIPFLLRLGRGLVRRQFRWVLLSAVVGLSISTSWFLALGFSYSWEPVKGFFLFENLGRFLGTDFGPQRGLFYYVGVFFADFFPWSLLFPVGLVWLYRSRDSVAIHDVRTSVLFLASWLVTFFVVFSFSLNKQEYYILPLYPAASLLLALFLTNRPASGFMKWLVSPLILILGLVIWWLTTQIFDGTALLWLPPLALVSCAVCAWFRKTKSTILALGVFYCLAFSTYLGPFERYRPVSHFARTIQAKTALARSPDEVRSGYYRFAAPSLRFYLDTEILEIIAFEEAVRVLQTSSEVFLITDPSSFEDLHVRLGDRIVIEETSPRLETRARTLVSVLLGDHPFDRRTSWTSDLYLISNRVQ
jgi:hypothetical protein